jgi:hypothetical protein
MNKKDGYVDADSSAVVCEQEKHHQISAKGLGATTTTLTKISNNSKIFYCCILK